MNEDLLKINPPELDKQEDNFSLLSELHETPYLTQRELSLKLNMSLGKTNYLINELVKTGMLKVKNFSNNPGKLKKVKYLLTTKGIQQKVSLTYHFLKRKEAEYNQIKKEWEKLKSTPEAVADDEFIPEEVGKIL